MHVVKILKDFQVDDSNTTCLAVSGGSGSAVRPFI